MKRLERIEQLADLTAEQGRRGGFVELHCRSLRNHYADGTVSREYRCDFVDHRGSDGVCIVLYRPGARHSGVPAADTDVFLLRNPRPTITLRPTEPESSPFLLETPAGVLEPDDDRSPDGIRARAAAEAREEAGFTLRLDAVRFLGGPTYVSPGCHTERIHYCCAVVDPAAREAPTYDGTPNEECMAPVTMSLAAALAACRDFGPGDAKTEIALARLHALMLAPESSQA